MLQIIGILLLMAGATGMALSWCQSQKERLRLLKNIRQLYEYLQNEMIYSKAALPEICRKLSTQKDPFSQVFSNIYEEINKNNGCSFEEIWERNMTAYLSQAPLKEREAALLTGFPQSLVFRDGKGQAGSLERYLEEITHYGNELEEELKSKNKIAMCLGVMGGMMAVILLI